MSMEDLKEIVEEMDSLWGQYQRDMDDLSSEENDEERECGRCQRVFMFNPHRRDGGIEHPVWGSLCPECAIEVEAEESAAR